MAKEHPAEADAWQLWERWISEIVADVWSVGRVGIASTLGLMGVVSLPQVFVFRVNVNDPHPTPWIRVKLSAAIGEAFYPQPAWKQLAQLWEDYYPLSGATPKQREILEEPGADDPEVGPVIDSSPPGGVARPFTGQVMDTDELNPARLRMLLRHWRRDPQHMYRTRPIVVFAAIGQGRVDGGITPEEESAVIGKLLSHWAVSSTLQAAAGCSSISATGWWQGGEGAKVRPELRVRKRSHLIRSRS